MVAKAKTGSKGSAAATVAVVGLAAIVAGMNQAPGYVFTQPSEHEPLVAAGLVEVNAAMKDPSGGLATRATQAGIDKVKAEAGGAPAASGWDKQTIGAGDVGTVPAAVLTGEKPKFVIESDVAIPKISNRGRTGESIYPFDQLEVNQSFFVPKEAKNLASTISGANKRFAEVVTDAQGNPVMRKNKKGVDVPATKQTRKFIVRNFTNVQGVKGSRIWRVPVTSTAEATDEA